MEQMDRLWPGGPVFYYDDALFKPGTDAFLLGAFARPRAGDRVCDLGAGTGLIGLLLLAREPSLTLHNVELQAAALRLAERTAQANGLAVSQHLADLRHLEGVLPAGSMDYVVESDSKTDVRRPMVNAILSAGYSLLMLKPMDVTLEDIFLQLTSEDKGGI